MKKIIAVKTDRTNYAPVGLYRVRASWTLSFTFDSIKNTIDTA